MPDDPVVQSSGLDAALKNVGAIGEKAAASASKGQINAAGTFAPIIPPGPRLNPYVDPGPFGHVIIGGFTLPGVVISIDGAEKPEEWSLQKGQGASGSTNVWKGTRVAESIKIVLNAHNRDAFDGLYTIQTVLRPNFGRKPPSLSIVNGVINFNRINRVGLKNVGQPKPAPGLSWTCEVELVEYDPSKAVSAGPAGPAKATSPGGYKRAPLPTANEKALAEFQRSLNEALKL